jgi:hypothetical protein
MTVSRDFASDRAQTAAAAERRAWTRPSLVRLPAGMAEAGGSTSPDGAIGLS